MRIFSSLVLFFLLMSPGFAQTKINAKITGKVVDAATQKPVEYATITISDVKSKPITGGVTDTKGVFTVQNIPAGLYTITIDFIGYKIYRQDNVEITDQKKNISLKNKNKTRKKKKKYNVIQRYVGNTEDRI